MNLDDIRSLLILVTVAAAVVWLAPLAAHCLYKLWLKIGGGQRYR